MKNLKISVIVPCYNQSEFLGECLQSILDQTYPHWECIVVDDGSTDDTKLIAEKWVDKDYRFTYFYKENGGLSSARNFGLDKATGDLIQFLDSDDLIVNTKFEKSISFFQQENTDIVITNFSMLEGNMIKEPFCDITKYDFTYKNILLQWDIDFNFPIHSLIISNKSIKNLRFEEKFYAKEDWIMWLSIFRNKIVVNFINEPLALYRMHGSNMTKDTNHMNTYTIKAFKYILKNIESEFFDVFVDRFELEIKKPMKEMERYINKINNRPWYKKIFYAIIGKK